MESEKQLLFLLLLLVSSFSLKFCFGIDTITSTKFIKDPSTISSNGGYFELGFFSPLNSTSRYVGIWYKEASPQTVVWVANRDKPLNDSSGVFTISNDGNLVVLDGRNTILWSSNVSKPTMNTTARILDSGNLILDDSASGGVLWESFKYPSNRFLPFMKFIANKRTKEEVGLTSWKSLSDPSAGNFSMTMVVLSVPEVFIWTGHNLYWRSGPWNGQSFVGVPGMNPVYLEGFNLVIDDQTYSLSFGNGDGQQALRFHYTLSFQGNLVERFWNFSEQKWELSWFALKTPCDFYGTCGAFGICYAQTSPICSCLRGFEPRKREEWNQGNWSNGCVRKTPLQCEKLNNGNTEQGKEDGFLKLERVKLPHFAEWNSSVSIDDCKSTCLDNCLCSAYAYASGLHCMLWTGNLTDIQTFDSGGSDLYLRVAYTELDDVKDNKGIVIALVISGAFILIVLTYILCRRMTHKKGKKSRKTIFSEVKGKFMKLRKGNMIGDNLNHVKLQELPLYDFKKLAIATNDFHESNKLGQGGFGPVYKGRLSDGQEIAVKRLSRASDQGLEEFTNEVMVISKLQHRNLVRLLGCCIEEEEKMLVYEYMPNLSLDALIFDTTREKFLDWRSRFDIIDGIARGLLYLHRDSRLKIIHRDLKASNILLDKDFVPKISDFGMARIFCSNEAQARTLRIVGTYGYMSPEYAMHGQISEKSDVFSFGVLVLEIISGRRNTSFHHHEQAISLLGFAWILWSEDNVSSMIDPRIYEVRYHSEILRCIQVGLLCVQELANDRPNVSTIISMLNSEIVDLPPPYQPGFIGRPSPSITDSSPQNLDKCSVNTLTITTVLGR